MGFRLYTAILYHHVGVQMRETASHLPSARCAGLGTVFLGGGVPPMAMPAPIVAAAAVADSILYGHTSDDSAGGRADHIARVRVSRAAGAADDSTAWPPWMEISRCLSARGERPRRDDDVLGEGDRRRGHRPWGGVGRGHGCPPTDNGDSSFIYLFRIFGSLRS